MRSGNPRTLSIFDRKDRRGLSAAFKKHYPSVVIHAAAHKHVPLMESVPIEAIQNNVFGTLNIVEESLRNGVKRPRASPRWRPKQQT